MRWARQRHQQQQQHHPQKQITDEADDDNDGANRDETAFPLFDCVQILMSVISNYRHVNN